MTFKRFNKDLINKISLSSLCLVFVMSLFGPCLITPQTREKHQPALLGYVLASSFWGKKKSGRSSAYAKSSSGLNKLNFIFYGSRCY